ncbi:MAG: histidine phosphatase family protein [Clostridia bacterium]|nr:histidine phosphatase family protein [Clostridia bacterium]
MRILIVRHGDPDYANDTLTEKGRREAALLAEKLSKEKIDYIYSSPLGRAKDTCMYVAKALKRENEVVVKDWLREFDARPIMPDLGRPSRIWDMLPATWSNDEKMYDRNEWFDQDYHREAHTKEKYELVGKGLNGLLASHGYVREGGYYRVEKSNRDTIALFCHFGVEMVLLSHIFGVSPIPLLHGFTALPTSVTTLYSEERRKGIASFRCCGFGELTHLYVGNEPPSFAARFCETFDSDERHD